MSHEKLAYSIDDACKLCSIGRTTLFAAIKRGELQVHKIGRRTLIRGDALTAWLCTKRRQAKPGSVTNTQ